MKKQIQTTKWGNKMPIKWITSRKQKEFGGEFSCFRLKNPQTGLGGGRLMPTKRILL
ncbi:MAG: hypothetical protein I8H71_05980 [Xanthomonadaceae bacterium]|nr:hypothetical protein [Xanthomonadaceae bacterium]